MKKLIKIFSILLIVLLCGCSQKEVIEKEEETVELPPLEYSFSMIMAGDSLIHSGVLYLYRCFGG